MTSLVATGQFLQLSFLILPRFEGCNNNNNNNKKNKEREEGEVQKLVHSAINVLRRDAMTVNVARALETPLTPSTHFYFPIHADLGIDIT